MGTKTRQVPPQPLLLGFCLLATAVTLMQASPFGNFTAAPFPSSSQPARLLPTNQHSWKTSKTSEVLPHSTSRDLPYHHTLMHHLKDLEVGEG